MHDARAPAHSRPPADWGAAFSALPVEAPSPSGWPRVAATLDARARVRWPLWLATAAALALVALLPLQWWRQEHRIDAWPVAASTPAQGTGAAAIDAEPASPAASGNHSRAGRAVASRLPASPSMDVPAATVAVLARVRGNDDGRKPGPPAAASSSRERVAAAGTQPSIRPRDAAAAADAVSTSGAVAAGGSAPAHAIGPGDPGTTAAAATPELERLHAESAQLEALVALARDDRIATGAVAALGGELESRVARIDAALAEPSTSAEQQLGLWRERVEALRALAGFETTQRLLAARGEQYDAMLVSVD